MGDVKVSETVEWAKMPTDWRILVAYADCPECGAEVTIQPVPGKLGVCHECGEMMVVFVLPLTLNDAERPICALEAKIKDGRGSILVMPGFFEFGEWVL